MNKKKIIIPAAIIIVLLLGGLGYTFYNLQQQKKNNADLQQLATLDKKEMENEYSQFALQYDELKRSIKTIRSCSSSQRNSSAHKSFLQN